MYLNKLKYYYSDLISVLYTIQIIIKTYSNRLKVCRILLLYKQECSNFKRIINY